VAGLTFVNQIGAADGLNQAAPGSFIPDTFVRWAQDVLFDRVGYVRRRAPFELFPTYNNAVVPVITYPSTVNERAINVVSTMNPLGERITGLVLSTASATRILFYDENFRNTGSSSLGLIIPSESIFDCKPASNGGSWLSFLESYKSATSSNEYYQYYWYGGHGTEQTVTGVSFATNGSGSNTSYGNTLTGTFDASTITTGMFVYVNYDPAGGTAYNDYYIGMVKSASSNQIILEKDIIRFHFNASAATAARNTNMRVKFRNVRPYIRVHSRGLINYNGSGGNITSGAIGTEGEGHFKSADLGGSIRNINWAIYRASDGEWLGDVESAIDNTTIDLNNTYHSTNANTVMRADEYVAYPYQVVPNATVNDAATDKFAGIFNATYAGYQWYGNGGNSVDQNRVVFSSPHNSEGVDLSLDSADSIIIPGTAEMRGMAASSSGLVIFTSDKTFILRGNYRANFSLEDLYPEGCLSSMSIVEYGGGVFWASRLGILYYDGASVRNLTESNLGVYYTDSVRTFDVNTDRIYSFLHKDYLFVHFTAFDSVFKPARYEPVYAGSIDNTPAIADFDNEDWDPDFTMDDFLVENNVPVYWDYIEMYDSTAANSSKLIPIWAQGFSFSNAVLVSGNTTVDGLSYTGADANGLAGQTINTADINVGDLVLGANIPADTTVVSKTDADTIVLSAAPTASGTQTIQIVTGTPTYRWHSIGSQFVWGPVRKSQGITFAIYLPTNAITTLSNFDFRGATKIDAISGIKAIMAVNVINPTFTVTKKALTSNVATLTVSEIGIPSGVSITVTGVDSTFDGTYTVTSVSGNDVSYSKTASNVASIAATGTITAKGASGTDGVYSRIIDVDSILETSNEQNTSIDAALIENTAKDTASYIKGPDFYLQTKHYTVGDPVLKKWFRQIMLNLYLLDGGLRMDIVDMEDNDRIDVQKKRHVNWELFGEAGYSWDEWETIVLPKLLSPNRSTWKNTKSLNKSWYEISDAEFTRRRKKISWRYPSAGFRLYQMNNYRPANYQNSQRPHTIMMDSWNIGFKPMRASRV
jgi:hypothetical protein